jgi:hypothetical protein
MVLAENLNYGSREDEEAEQLRKFDDYKGTQLQVDKINLIGCYVKGKLVMTYKSCEKCDKEDNYQECIEFRKTVNRYQREFSDQSGHTYL